MDGERPRTHKRLKNRQLTLTYIYQKSKAVPLHAMVALGEREGIAPTHS
jgi:hypothetical protein